MISRSLSPRHGASSGCGWRNGPHIWRVAANISNKQSRTTDKGWSSSLEVGRGSNNSSPLKINYVANYTQRPRNQTVRPKQCKSDMRFGKWNVSSLYRQPTLVGTLRNRKALPTDGGYVFTTCITR